MFIVAESMRLYSYFFRYVVARSCFPSPCCTWLFPAVVATTTPKAKNGHRHVPTEALDMTFKAMDA